MMPKHRRTRAENRAKRIEAERKLNDDYVAERNKPPPFQVPMPRAPPPTPPATPRARCTELAGRFDAIVQMLTAAVESADSPALKMPGRETATVVLALGIGLGLLRTIDRSVRITGLSTPSGS
jgi:hypothetical protein